MSPKLFPTLATLAIAVAGAVAMTSAFAVEATQYIPEPGTLTRAAVKAEMSSANVHSTVRQYGEATVFVDRPSTQSRELVRAQAADAPVRVAQFGEATVFIDQPGERSRNEVRAETLAAARAARHQ